MWGVVFVVGGWGRGRVGVGWSLLVVVLVFGGGLRRGEGSGGGCLRGVLRGDLKGWERALAAGLRRRRLEGWMGDMVERLSDSTVLERKRGNKSVVIVIGGEGL